MNEIDKILENKPDHEKKARAFIGAVTTYSQTNPSVNISIWLFSDEPIANEFTDRHMPGYRNRLSDIDHQIEIRSLDQSSVMVNVNGYEAEVANASTQIGQLAEIFGGVQDTESEDIATEADGKITDELSFDFS